MTFDELCDYVSNKKVYITAQLASESRPRVSHVLKEAEIIRLPSKQKLRVICFGDVGAANSIFELQKNCILIEENAVKSIDRIEDGIIIITADAFYKISET